jgi:tetratricopeptide (TPR) repeat protein
LTVTNSSAENEELANAHRTAATAESAMAQHDAALTHYLAALELDKDLGQSARIVTDLKGIALAMEKLGRKTEAEAYARRAMAADEAAHSLPGKPGKNSHY